MQLICCLAHLVLNVYARIGLGVVEACQLTNGESRSDFHVVEFEIILVDLRMKAGDYSRSRRVISIAEEVSARRFREADLLGEVSEDIMEDFIILLRDSIDGQTHSHCSNFMRMSDLHVVEFDRVLGRVESFRESFHFISQ